MLACGDNSAARIVPMIARMSTKSSNDASLSTVRPTNPSTRRGRRAAPDVCGAGWDTAAPYTVCASSIVTAGIYFLFLPKRRRMGACSGTANWVVASISTGTGALGWYFGAAGRYNAAAGTGLVSDGEVGGARRGAAAVGAGAAST